MAKTIGIIGTLDTKGPKISYVKKEIERRGCRALVIDAGVFTASSVVPEYRPRKLLRQVVNNWRTLSLGAIAVKPCR